jgi:hypothetical protein
MAAPAIPISTNKPPELPADTKSVKISYGKTRSLKLYKADLGGDTSSKMEHWLHEMIRVYKDKHERLHKTLIPKWERLYMGKPREDEKSFPWPNCSNLVVQVIGQQVDDLAARVIGLLYQTSPLAVFRYVAKTEDPTKAADKARLLETFFDLVGYEPTELDLYPKESRWASESAKLGTSFVKVMPEQRIEAVVIGYDEDKKKTRLKEETLYKGPKAVNVRHDDVMMDFDADTIADSRLVTHRVTLSRLQMEERVSQGFYEQSAWETIENRPDRYTPTDEINKENKDKSGAVDTQDNVTAVWDIYECWFPWSTELSKKEGGGARKFRLIWWYHYETRTVMNRVFNFMPNNKCAIIRTRLNSSDKGAYGRGYADMLEHAQDEVSTTHNQRADATTAGILGLNRVDPAGGSSLDRNMQIYPFAVLPFKKDSFEHITLGNPAMASISSQNEATILQLIEARTAVGQAIAGMGTGSVGKKGQYGSMGTLAVMQDSNSRSNYRTSDFRHSHVELVSMLMEVYGIYGMGAPGSMFGLDDDTLMEALQDYVDHRIRIPIRAATASANKEVEKQNLMLLGNWVQGHHKNIINMLQAIAQAQIPPEAKEFFIKVIESQNNLAKQLFRAFGFDQPDEFVPDAPDELRSQQDGQSLPNGPAGAAPSPVADPRAAIVQSIASRLGGGMGGPGGPASPGTPEAS